MKTLNDFKSANLSPVQMRFIAQFDGTLESVLNFNDLHMVLNPSHSGHYFIDHVTRDGEVITTKDTTGESALWFASEEQVTNDYALARLLNEFIKSFNPVKLSTLTDSYGKSRNANRAAFLLNGEIATVRGMKL